MLSSDCLTENGTADSSRATGFVFDSLSGALRPQRDIEKSSQTIVTTLSLLASQRSHDPNQCKCWQEEKGVTDTLWCMLSCVSVWQRKACLKDGEWASRL